jgi:hypothetical protein
MQWGFAVSELAPPQSKTAKPFVFISCLGFTAEERAAMKERLSKEKADRESAVLARLDAMPEPDRTLGRRLHATHTASAPYLMPLTCYEMPAYARACKAVCFYLKRV